MLLDERAKVSPGVKFKDAELLGMPFAVVFGRGFAEGKVELRNRLSGETSEVEVAGLAERLTALSAITSCD